MISKTAEYALRAMVWLANHPSAAQLADQLANATKAPRRYLHKVLQDLIHAGLLRSQPGPGGGYSLAIAPASITILDVISTAAPLERIRECPLGLSTHTSLCPLHAELDKAYAATEQAFARVTLEGLLRSAQNIVPLCEVK